MNYKLSPSELTYLFEGCKYCFSLKVKYGIGQVSMPMPGIFSAIAGRQKRFYDRKRTEEFCPKLLPGIVAYGENWVESVPIKAEKSSNTCFIKGRFDLVVKFDEGGYGVIDCKTASPSEEKAKMYGRQLQAYAYALENSSARGLSLSPVTRLGLLFFEPSSFEQVDNEHQAFQGRLTWQEIEKNDQGFLDFISEVITVLDSDQILPEEGCKWCDYRRKTKDIDSKTPIGAEKLKIHKAPGCPLCESLMIKRSGKFGEFWSCQKFPECRGTRPSS